jgi:hypothetical protein
MAKKFSNGANGINIPIVGGSSADFVKLTGYNPARVKARIQFITPELAEEWVKLAEEGNRSKRPRRVDTMAHDMVEGKFVFTGVPILFDEDGGIFDGMHRLAACVRSQKGFWALVITGISREQAMPAVDDVSVRKHADRLKIIYGIENANTTASICLILWQFTRPDRSSSWGQPSFAEIEKMFLKYRRDIDWVIHTIGNKIDPGLSCGGAPVLAPFVFVRSLDMKRIEKAAVAFKTGDSLTDNHPMRKLRQKVSTTGTNRKLGNKNSSSQFSRFALALYTLECLERVIDKKMNERTIPKADPEVLPRLIERLRACPTAVRLPRAPRPLPSDVTETTGTTRD